MQQIEDDLTASPRVNMLKESMQTTFVYLILVNFLLVTGPVCGNHQTTVEAMACCEKGHNDVTRPGLSDAHSSSCCADCDMGKFQGIKKQDQTRLFISFEPVAFLSNANPDLTLPLSMEALAFEPIGFSSPPEVFLLDRSLRI